jgi:hypothetical protein
MCDLEHTSTSPNERCASLSQSHSVQSENQQLRTLIRDVLPTVEEQRAQVCAVRAAH